MVKFYTQSYSYDYPFPTVTLAYFLRYPNPYSRHVLSTDVLERHFDPETQRLYTTRLHLKRSRLPRAILSLIPRSLLGASSNGDSQTFILETSTVDVKEGWMKTESRNMEFKNLLEVLERQTFYRRDASNTDAQSVDGAAAATNAESVTAMSSLSAPSPSRLSYFTSTKDSEAAASPVLEDRTDVTTTVTLHSRFGQRLRRARAAGDTASSGASEEEAPQKMGFFRSWSQASLQRSIEAIGLSRTSKSQPNATEGMKVVLERLRQGGLVAVLEGMRRDREATRDAKAGAFKLISGGRGEER
jgi:4-amino-4-deoxychorismate lyase